LAVNPKLDYVRVRTEDEVLIVAEALAETLLGDQEYTVEATVKGTELVGTAYIPVFDYATPEGGRYHEVIAGDFVTSATGTGVVHMAPAFGEDDFKAAKDAGIGMLQLIEPDGTFSAAATDFAGRFCKEADRDIIRNLNARDLLFKEEVYRHDYPFCWRAEDDPLIQYARPAWFIRTTDVIHRTIANNQKINWIPGHIKDGRFGDFLANNVDWALSRERFWGTPLNIWTCATCEHRIAPKNADEILALNPNAFDAFAEAKAADPSLSEHLMVHKPWIDEVTMPCAKCDGTMHRVPEVIDCWFDSGCMPFAQWGYPHQGAEQFQNAFPADFISEAIDQTRGWFYSLLMISSLLHEETTAPHPYKTCIVLGHVCDKKGRKESKSKGNYTPPDAILNNDGADAMRWYFYSANPPWNNTRYSPEAVRQSQQDFLVKLRNVYAFFVIYANIDGFNPTTSPRRAPSERGLLDRWITSELHLTVREVTSWMDDYRLYDAAQRLIRFADALSNWYVRRSRDRFWASAEGPEAQDKWDAYHTLYEVMTTVSKVAAPFVPFLTEQLHRNLVLSVDPGAPESVHLCDWPSHDEAVIDERLSEEMAAVRDLVSLGLQTRATHKLKVRQPLAEAELILGKPALTDRLKPYAGLIGEELNVKKVTFTQDAVGRVAFNLKPNYRALGPIFGKRMPLVRSALDATDGDALRQSLSAEGAVQLMLSDGEEITLTDEHLQVQVQAQDGYAAAGGAAGVVVLNTALNEALITEGLAREVISRIQGIRKDEAFDYTARIRVAMTGDAALQEALRVHGDTIAAETLATQLDLVEVLPEGGARAEIEVDGHPLALSVRVVS
jgi:isoleucyl-tRNA synthetase